MNNNRYLDLESSGGGVPANSPLPDASPEPEMSPQTLTSMRRRSVPILTVPTSSFSPAILESGEAIQNKSRRSSVVMDSSAKQSSSEEKAAKNKTWLYIILSSIILLAMGGCGVFVYFKYFNPTSVADSQASATPQQITNGQFYINPDYKTDPNKGIQSFPLVSQSVSVSNTADNTKEVSITIEYSNIVEDEQFISLALVGVDRSDPVTTSSATSGESSGSWMQNFTGLIPVPPTQSTDHLSQITITRRLQLSQTNPSELYLLVDLTSATLSLIERIVIRSGSGVYDSSQLIPLQIPGQIMAKQYDARVGGNFNVVLGENSHTSPVTNYVQGMLLGNWLKYSVTVLKSGVYDIAVNYATLNDDIALTIKLGSMDLVTSLALTAGDSIDSIQTSSFTGRITMLGDQILRISMAASNDASSLNLYGLTFTLTTHITPTPLPTPTETGVPPVITPSTSTAPAPAEPTLSIPPVSTYFNGYFASWLPQAESSGSNLALAKVDKRYNMVSLAFLYPQAKYSKGQTDFTGTGIQFSSSTDIIKQAISSLRQNNPSVKVMIAVGGGTYNSWSQLNAAAIVDFLSDFNLDGVDISYAPDPTLCDFSNCCTLVDGKVECKSDTQYNTVIKTIRTALDEYAISINRAERYLLSISGWSTGAYGEGAFTDETPKDGRTGMLLNVLRDAEASAAVDIINVISYTASTDYSLDRTLAAYKAAAAQGKFKGSILMGFCIPSQDPFGPEFTTSQISPLVSKLMNSGSQGANFWYIQGDQTIYNTGYSTAIAQGIGIIANTPDQPTSTSTGPDITPTPTEPTSTPTPVPVVSSTGTSKTPTTTTPTATPTSTPTTTPTTTGSTSPSDPTSSPSTGVLYLGGYFSTWLQQAQLSAAQLDISKLKNYNVVYISFMLPNAQYKKGQTDFSGTGIQFTSSPAMIKEALTILRQNNPGIKILISVGGATYYRWDKLNAAAIKDFVVDFNLDGVDIDYEPDTSLCDYSNCCQIVNGKVKCNSDTQYINSIKSIRNALDSIGDNKHYLLGTAAWSIGAYGEGDYMNDLPKAGRTGMLLNILRDNQASAALDILNVMSYTASADYSLERALAAYKAAAAQGKFKGAIVMGFCVPAEDPFGPYFTANQAKNEVTKLISQGANGAFLWYIQGDRNGYLNALQQGIIDSNGVINNPGTPTPAEPTSTPTPVPVVSSTGTSKTPTTTTPTATPTTTPAPSSSPSKFGRVGVNLAGLEFGSKYPGTYDVDYTNNPHSEYDYFSRKGIKFIRLPFSWERIQRTLNGALDTAYLNLIKDSVNYAASKGMTVLLDCHNYARYNNIVLGSSSALTANHLADLWTKLATVFKGNNGIHGYDIMNEPYDLPSATVWPNAAQIVINAIRSVDTNTAIYIEGTQWSGAASWMNYNADLHKLTDPANNLVFSAHCYLDSDASGTRYTWSQQGVTTDIGVQRLTVFNNWLKQYGLRGHIGEIGVPQNDQNWLTALEKALKFCKDNDLEVSYWSAGIWWGNYELSIEPKNGVDSKQMNVLLQYL